MAAISLFKLPQLPSFPPSSSLLPPRRIPPKIPGNSLFVKLRRRSLACSIPPLLISRYAPMPIIKAKIIHSTARKAVPPAPCKVVGRPGSSRQLYRTGNHLQLQKKLHRFFCQFFVIAGTHFYQDSARRHVLVIVAAAIKIPLISPDSLSACFSALPNCLLFAMILTAHHQLYLNTLFSFHFFQVFLFRTASGRP